MTSQGNHYGRQSSIFGGLVRKLRDKLDHSGGCHLPNSACEPGQDRPVYIARQSKRNTEVPERARMPKNRRPHAVPGGPHQYYGRGPSRNPARPTHHHSMHGPAQTRALKRHTGHPQKTLYDRLTKQSVPAGGPAHTSSAAFDRRTKAASDPKPTLTRMRTTNKAHNYTERGTSPRHQSPGREEVHDRQYANPRQNVRPGKYTGYPGQDDYAQRSASYSPQRQQPSYVKNYPPTREQKRIADAARDERGRSPASVSRSRSFSPRRADEEYMRPNSRQSSHGPARHTPSPRHEYPHEHYRPEEHFDPSAEAPIEQSDVFVQPQGDTGKKPKKTSKSKKNTKAKASDVQIQILEDNFGADNMVPQATSSKMAKGKKKATSPPPPPQMLPYDPNTTFPKIIPVALPEYSSGPAPFPVHGAPDAGMFPDRADERFPASTPPKQRKKKKDRISSDPPQRDYAWDPPAMNPPPPCAPSTYAAPTQSFGAAAHGRADQGSRTRAYGPPPAPGNAQFDAYGRSVNQGGAIHGYGTPPAPRNARSSPSMSRASFHHVRQRIPQETWPEAAYEVKPQHSAGGSSSSSHSRSRSHSPRR